MRTTPRWLQQLAAAAQGLLAQACRLAALTLASESAAHLGPALPALAPLPPCHACSWPLPNSHKAAFFLDLTSSLFIADFRRPQVQPPCGLRFAGSLALAGRGSWRSFCSCAAAAAAPRASLASAPTVQTRSHLALPHRLPLPPPPAYPTNSVPQMTDWWYMNHTAQGPRHPSFDAQFATALGPGGEPQGQLSYYVQVRLVAA